MACMAVAFDQGKQTLKRHERLGVIERDFYSITVIATLIGRQTLANLMIAGKGSVGCDQGWRPQRFAVGPC